MRLIGLVEGWYLEHRLTIARTALFASCALLLALAFALPTRDTTLGSQQTPVAEGSTPDTDPAQARIAVLQAQLEEARNADERVLQTVFWSLGVLAAIAAALIAFSWFTNTRLSDRERSQLRQDITEAVNEETTKAEQRIAVALSAIEGRVTEEVERRMRTYEEDHQNRFNALTLGVAVTHTELLATAARAQAANGNFSEVLDTGRNILYIGLSVNLPNAITQGLDLIQTALQDGARPTIDMAAALNDLLARLPDMYSTDRDIIRVSLVQARDRSYTESWENQ